MHSVRRSVLYLVLCFVGVLGGCGGGEDAASTMPLRAGPITMTTATTASQEAARQLMDFAEANYAEYFPAHEATQSVAPFVYRYYPDTGVYLGVVIDSGSPFELNGVYVMGGLFGGSPRYVGQLTSFITPVIVSFEQAVWQSGANAVASDPAIRPFEEPGTPASFSTSLAIDFQGNGKPDLLGCYVSIPPHPRTKFPCRVLRPQADGSLTDVTRQLFGAGALPSLEAPREIVTGDFNGDGRPDVFIAGHGYDTAPFDGETNVLLISNPDGTYTDRSSTLPRTPDFSHSACVGDINGDGKLDIYVGNYGGGVAPYFLMGVGNGTFTQTRAGLPASIVNMQEKFLSCLIVDADGDGHADLVLGAADPGGSSDSIVLFNNGAANFNARTRYKLPKHPFGAGNIGVLDIATLDVNQDGKPDLLVYAQQFLSNTGTGLQVLVNSGNGTFVDETSARLGSSAIATTGSSCNFLRMADFNGDGWPDFYCNIGPTEVANRYWISDGYGRWNSPPPEALPQGSGYGIHAVDFDGDGRPDLLQVSQTPEGDVYYKSFFNRTGANAVP